MAFLLITVIALAPDFSEAGTAQYEIGSGDLLTVTVYGEEDLSLKAVRVAGNGKISFPLIGEIQVSGFTSKELEGHLIRLLKEGYLKKPKVTVSILEYRMFYVNGAVNRPGGYKYVDGLTVRKSIALAGGFTVRASTKKITLIRESNPSEPIESVGLNITVFPGDVLTVGESFF